MLSGQLDGNLRQIEQRLGIRINARGNQFQLSGPAINVSAGHELLIHLYAELCQGVTLTPESLHLQLQHADQGELELHGDDPAIEAIQIIRSKRGSIKRPGPNTWACL